MFVEEVLSKWVDEEEQDDDDQKRYRYFLALFIDSRYPSVSHSIPERRDTAHGLLHEENHV